MKVLRFLVLAAIMAVVAFAADYRTELEYTVSFDGFQKCIHQYSLTPDGDWTTYTFRDTIIIKCTNYADSTDTAIVTYTTGASHSVAITIDSLVAKINASAVSRHLTAYDSTTYLKLRADDSNYQIVRVGTDTGQTAAKVLPSAAYRRVDTTIYYPTRGSHWPFKPSDWDKVKLEYGFTKQASLANCSLVHVIQFSNNRNWDTCRKVDIKTDTLNIARDSLFSTTGWNLHKYMTSTDTLLQWDEMRLLFIRIMVLSDTGAAFLTKADSSYPVYIDYIIEGWNGNAGIK